MANNFVANIYIVKNGIRSRRQEQGSTLQLNGGTSDLAVQSFLQSKYPDAQVTVNSVQWR